jgi:hypothetical protein
MIGFVWFLAFASLGAGNFGTAILCFLALFLHYTG